MCRFRLAGLLACVGLTAVCVTAWGARPEAEDAWAPAENSRPRTDFYGDPLPVGAVARYGALRLCHAGPVTGMAFMPDGKTLVSAGRDDAIRFWEVSTGKEVRTISAPVKARGSGFALSPDGKLMAVVNGQFGLEVRDVANWKTVPTLGGDFDGISALAFSADGKLLAVGCGDLSVRVFDVMTGKRLWQFRANYAAARLAFVPDGTALIAGEERDRDGTMEGGVRVWSIASGKELHRFVLDGPVSGLACSRDGRTVAAVGHYFFKVRLWDLRSGREKTALPARGALSVAFARDGVTLAVGEGESIRLWDYTKEKEVGILFGGLTDHVTDLALSPDGKILATLAVDAENRIHLWDWAAQREIFVAPGHRTPVISVAPSPDGKLLATGGIETCNKYSVLRGPAAGYVQLRPGQRDKMLRIWDTGTGKELHVLQPYAERPGRDDYQYHITAVGFSPDSRLLASTCRGATQPLRLWDPRTGRVLREFDIDNGYDKAAGQPTFSPDGLVIAAGGAKGPRFWDVRSGKELDLIDPQMLNVGAVSFAPDGKTLAAMAGDSPLRVWDLATGKECMRAAKGTAGNFAVFTPDGKAVATIEDGRIQLWDAAHGTLVRTWPRDGGRAARGPLAISPDGKFIVVSAGPFVYLLETATWQEVRRFEGHRGLVMDIAFSADGRRFYTGSDDYTVLAYDPLSPEGVGEQTSPGVAGRTPLDQLWKELGRAVGPGGYRAACLLAARPAEAVPYLAKRIKPSPRGDRAAIGKLIDDLDSQDFAARARAFEKLGELEMQAEPALRRAAKDSRSAEVRKQANILLVRLTGPLSPLNLRITRAVQVLERIGTDGARTALAEFAKDSPSAENAAQAKAALARLARRIHDQDTKDKKRTRKQGG